MQALNDHSLLIVVSVLGVAVIVLLVAVFWMYAKLRKFLTGPGAQDIGDSLMTVETNVKDLHQFKAEIEAYLATVEKRLRKSVQSVHTVRFNPFHGTGGGGNQSFATAFLNEEGDGVLISSLYSREHVSVFAKPVKGHVSGHELSGEEREAMDEAKKGLK